MEIQMQVFIFCNCRMLLWSHNNHCTATVNYALWNIDIYLINLYLRTHSPLWIFLCRPVVIYNNKLYKHVAWLNIYHWNQIFCQLIVIKQCCPVEKKMKNTVTLERTMKFQANGQYFSPCATFSSIFKLIRLKIDTEIPLLHNSF